MLGNSSPNRSIKDIAAYPDLAKSAVSSSVLLTILRESYQFDIQRGDLRFALSTAKRCAKVAQESGSSSDVLSAVQIDLAFIHFRISEVTSGPWRGLSRNFHLRCAAMYLGRAQSGLKSGDPEKPNVGILQVYRDLACVRERQGRYDEADSLWHSAISLGDIILKSCGSNGGTGEEALLGPRTHFGYFEFLCRIGRDREALATGEAFLDKYCGGSTFRDFTILCLTKLKVIAESSKMHELVARYEYQLKVLN